MSKEFLSAAVDGAATDQEWDVLLAAMESDPGLKAAWSRQWACRDAREGVTALAKPDFCNGVMAAIAAEVPLPSRVVPLARPAAVPSPTPALRRPRLRNWQALVPLSAAAGVVAAVLFVGGFKGVVTDPAQVAVTASPATTVAQATPASDDHQALALSDEDKARILSVYAMEHSNSLAERGMGGTLANARFAAHTADYRPDGQ